MYYIIQYVLYLGLPNLILSAILFVKIKVENKVVQCASRYHLLRYLMSVLCAKFGGGIIKCTIILPSYPTIYGTFY